MERSRREMSRAPVMRKRTAMFQQGFPGSRRSRYQKDCCAKLVGKRYAGSPKESAVGFVDDGIERILPPLSISGGLRCGIELVLLARHAGDFFNFVRGATVFRRGGAGFGGEGGNGSQAKDLLGSEGDANLRCAGDDLK